MTSCACQAAIFVSLEKARLPYLVPVKADLALAIKSAYLDLLTLDFGQKTPILRARIQWPVPFNSINLPQADVLQIVMIVECR